MRLQELLTQYNSTIIAQHIPGSQNVVADTLSRVNIGDNWQLNRTVFQQIQ
jgi:hypothetical protein